MSQSTQSPEEQLLSLPDFSAIAPDEQESTFPPSPRPPWWRRRGGIITIILVVLVILASILAFVYLNRQRPITYQFQQATQGNFSLTVSATGPLQSAIYNLVFTGTGTGTVTISEIDVSVGQTVTKGQVLAKLNKTSLQDAVNTAQAGVLTAQTGVNTAQANLSKAQAQSNANVQSAQVALNNAQASLGTTLTQSQTSVSAAQTTLSNSQTNLTNTQTQSAANNSAAQTTLSNAQTSLSHTQTQSAASNSAAQTTLSNAQTSLSNTQTTANAQINQAAAQEAQSIAMCTPTPTPAPASTPTSTPTPTPITPPPTPSLSCVQLAINTYNTAVAQAEASIATAQGAVNTAQQQLTLTETQSTSSNATAQNTVNSAQKSVTTTTATSTSNNAAAQATVNSAQQSVTSAAAQASSNNTTAQNTVNAAASSLATAQANANASVTSQQGLVKTAQSQMVTALTTLQTAKHNLDNATLLAPHDGIVTTINGTVGGTPGAPASASVTTTSSASGNTFIQIADTSTLQVLAAVNESDTANLKVGEPAQFTVSAYGNRLFTGIVSAISPIGQTVSNVVSYPVTIDVNKDDLQNANLLPGMTASVTIVVVQRPNVVLIPVNAINFARTATGTVNGIPPIITTQQASSALAQARQMRTELINQNPSVVQDNPTPAYVIEQPVGRTVFITVPVVLGLTDDTYYVVLQGLSPGDIVVVGAQRG